MIASIVGLMNSGKTLRMTQLLYKHWLEGKEIITNYDLNFPHYKVNKDWLIQRSKKQDEVLTNCAIGFDELWIWLDARKNMHNTVATYFFLQSSKDDSPIYLTAQDNMQNDKRLRDNLHRVEQCSRVLKYGKKYIPIDEEQRILDPNLQDFLFIKVETFKRKNISGFTQIIKAGEKYIKAKPIFQLYDTRQKMTMN